MRSAKTFQPDGIWRTPSGRLKVVDKAYMAALHHQHRLGRLAPLPILKNLSRSGPLELHHTRNPSGGKPRDCDASVVPLSREQHQYLEMNPAEEETFRRLEGVWAAYSWWASHAPEGEQSGQDFLAWTILKRSDEHLIRY